MVICVVNALCLNFDSRYLPEHSLFSLFIIVQEMESLGVRGGRDCLAIIEQKKKTTASTTVYLLRTLFILDSGRNRDRFFGLFLSASDLSNRKKK